MQKVQSEMRQQHRTIVAVNDAVGAAMLPSYANVKVRPITARQIMDIRQTTQMLSAINADDEQQCETVIAIAARYGLHLPMLSKGEPPPQLQLSIADLLIMVQAQFPTSHTTGPLHSAYDTVNAIDEVNAVIAAQPAITLPLSRLAAATQQRNQASQSNTVSRVSKAARPYTMREINAAVFTFSSWRIVADIPCQLCLLGFAARYLCSVCGALFCNNCGTLTSDGLPICESCPHNNTQHAHSHGHGQQRQALRVLVGSEPETILAYEGNNEHFARMASVLAQNRGYRPRVSFAAHNAPAPHNNISTDKSSWATSADCSSSEQEDDTADEDERNKRGREQYHLI